MPDPNGLYPDSKMAEAVRLGLSQFRYVDVAGSAASAPSAGVFTLNTAGVKTTAALLAAAGLTTSFATLSFAVNTAPAGVTIAQGAGSAVYAQGSAPSFSNVSVTNNPVTLTMALGDVVSVLYSGT